jgi:H+-transporting ATPase
VTSTGINTFFGRAANLMAQVENHSHLQDVLKKISLFCIFFIIIWSVVELIVQFGVRKKECNGVGHCTTLDNILVLLVGGIPIAMPTVLSVTMYAPIFILSYFIILSKKFKKNKIKYNIK